MRSDHLSKHVMAHSPDCHSKNDDSHDNVTKSDYNSNLDISHSHIPVSRSSSKSATLKVPEFKPYHIASKKEKRNVCKFCHKLLTINRMLNVMRKSTVQIELLTILSILKLIINTTSQHILKTNQTCRKKCVAFAMKLFLN